MYKKILILILILSILPIADASYTKRVPMQINNTGNASILTDFEVYVNITYDSDMNTDFSDLFIFNNVTKKAIPFHIKHKVDSSFANIWFKVDTLSASSWTNNTFYLFYGSDDTVSKSNSDSTYMFFDNFTGTNINTTKWTEVDTGSKISQNNELIINGGTGSWLNTVIYSNINLTRPFIYEFNLNRTSATNNIGFFIKDSSSTLLSFPGYMYAVNFYSYGNDEPIIYEQTTERIRYGAGLAGALVGNKRYFKIITNSTGATYYISNETTTWNGIYTGTFNGTVSLKIGFASYSGNMNFDDVIVRKYAPIEPNTILGSESNNSDSYIVTTSATSVNTKSAILNGYVSIENNPELVNTQKNLYFKYGAKSGIYHYNSPVQQTTLTYNNSIYYDLSDNTVLFPGKTYYYILTDGTISGDEISFTVSSLTNLTARDFDKNYQELDDSNFDLEATAIVLPKPYTDILGAIFWGLVFSIIFIVGWIRQGEVTNMSIAGILIGASIFAFVPPEFRQVAYGLLAVSIMGILVSTIYKK